jgi:hypothetical protein
MRKEFVKIVFLTTIALFVSTLISAEAVSPSTGWGEPEIICSVIQGNANYPQISMIGSGEAICVWAQYDSFRPNIWANRFVPGYGWGIPDLIEFDNGAGAGLPCVSMNETGNAVAVWVQNDGSYNSVWSNRYVQGEGWGEAEMIETSDGNAMSPRVSTDRSGNAVAVWYQHDGSWNNVWANRYTHGIGWGTALLLENMNVGNAMGAQVATDRYGNAIAVWMQNDGADNDIFCSRYTTGASWGPAQMIDRSDEGSSDSPRIAMSPSGSAVAIWSRSDGARWNIWSSKYQMGDWGTPELIETDNSGDANNPEISMNDRGDAIAVWDQTDGMRSNIWSNTFSFGGGWDIAQMVEQIVEGHMFFPEVSIDANGNAVAVWVQDLGPVRNILSNRYIFDQGWGIPEPLESRNTGFAEMPDVGSDADGNTVAVWHQYNGEKNDILSNVFIAPDVTPPILAVDFPLEGTVSTNLNVVFSGMTTPGTEVIIDGFIVHTNEYGVFSAPIPLQPGENHVRVIAIDPSGNSVQVNRLVIFEDPVEDLIERMIWIETNISEMMVAIDDLEENISEMMINASDHDMIYENLSKMREQAASLDEDLSSLRAEFDSLDPSGEGVIGLMNKSISVLEEDIDDLNALIDAQEGRIDDIEAEVNEQGDDDNEVDIRGLKLTIGVLAAVSGFSLVLLFILMVLVIVLFVKRRKITEE